MATRTIGTEIVLSGEKEFNDAMKSVNSNLKNLRSDMAVVTAEFEGNANSVEALTAKQEILRESVDQHQAKVDALRKKYEAVKDQVGENSAAADKYKIELNNATAALIREKNALEKTTTAISNQKDAAEAAEKAARDQAEAAAKLAREQREAAEAAEKAARDQAEAAAKLAREQREAADAAERAAKEQETHNRKMEAAKKRADALKQGFEKLGTVTLAVGKTTAAGAAALTAAGSAALVGMIALAKEAAEEAKAAKESGELLTPAQQQWLGFAYQLDMLESSASNAKSALAKILLPSLRQLAGQGTVFLDNFTRDMNAAAGNTELQTQLLGEYIAKGAQLILDNLPKYIDAGKGIVSGVIEGFAGSEDQLLETGMELLGDLLSFVIEKAPDFASGGLELALKLIEGLNGKDMAEDAVIFVVRLSDAIAQAAPELLPAVAELVGQVPLGIAENADLLLEAGVKLVVGVAKGIFWAAVNLREASEMIVDELLSALSESENDFISFGGKILSWIIKGILGIRGGLPGIAQFAASVADAVAIPETRNSGGSSFGGDPTAMAFDVGRAVSTSSGKNTTKVANLTINTTSISREDMDMLVEYVDEKLGG